MNRETMEAGLAIVGSGASGLVSAIWAGRSARAKKILLLDSQPKPGAKILISGGGRSNVTNEKVLPSDYHGGARHFVKHVLAAFTPRDTVRFFEEIGVPLVLEDGGKYFPATHSAKTLLAALLREAERSGVTLKPNTRVTGIRKEEGGFSLEVSGSGPIFARKVILATGGLSHPATGSDGTGYGLAKSLGHRIVDTFPALTPLFSEDAGWKSLSGVSLEAGLSLFRKGKKAESARGDLLFAHFGFSGPAALDMSRHVASAQKEDGVQVVANFLPDENEAALARAFGSAREKNPRRLLKNFLAEEFHLPARLTGVLLEKAGVRGEGSIGQCSGENIKRLIRALLQCPLEVSGVAGYDKAEVTSGGVDLSEVKVATMESKLVPGLYFAGEILDVDGRLGGFNFQWCWSTGAIAGKAVSVKPD